MWRQNVAHFFFLAYGKRINIACPYERRHSSTNSPVVKVLPKGPFCAAFACISFIFFASSFCFCLNAASSYKAISQTITQCRSHKNIAFIPQCTVHNHPHHDAHFSLKFQHFCGYEFCCVSAERQDFSKVTVCLAWPDFSPQKARVGRPCHWKRVWAIAVDQYPK